MTEFLFDLLYAVSTAAIPVCAAFLVQFLHRKSAQIGAQTDSLTAKKVLDEVTTAVTTAVTYVSQTYVDGLKKYGNFTRENQKVALSLSLEQAQNLLTADARDFLEKAYGNLNYFLVSKIEAEVRRQKLGEAVFSVPLEAVEAEKESPDVASVAAATAAATAAAVVQNAVSQANPAGGADSSVEGGETQAV